MTRRFTRPRGAALTAARLSLTAALACCLPACGAEQPAPAEGTFARTLDELERVALVRAGRTTRDTALAVGSSVDLVVDRFEVTWAHWDAGPDGSAAADGRAHDPTGIPAVFRPEARFASPEAVPEVWLKDVPVVGVTFREAQGFARSRGMRLPTFEEWMWCAIGTFGRRTPSGRSQVNIANTLEMRLGALRPVGSFEAGRTPETGLYDLVGNAWEWVEVRPDGPASAWSVVNADAWPQGRWRTAPARCVGGSFLTRARPLFDVPTRSSFAVARSAEHRASDVGFRCVAPAVDYLVARAGALGDAEPTDAETARAREIGARWGARALAALRKAREAHPGSQLLKELARGAEDA